MAKCSVRISGSIVIISKVQNGNEVACMNLMPNPGEWLLDWAKETHHQLINVVDGKVVPLLSKTA